MNVIDNKCVSLFNKICVYDMNEYSQAMFDIKIHPSLLNMIFFPRCGRSNKKKCERITETWSEKFIFYYSL